MQLKSFSVLHKRTFTHGQTKGFEVTLRLNFAVGQTDAGFVFQRSGKLVGTLTAVSIPGTPLQTADFRKLYETFAQRMDAAASGRVVSDRAARSTTDPADVKRTMAAAGCTLENAAPLAPPNQNFHDAAKTLTSPTKWSTFPPSAGGHYARWATWRFSRAPVNPRMVVHNLEHGGIAIWWGPNVPAATVDKLEAFYGASPNGMIGTPIAGLGNKVALTAWTGNPSTYYRDGDYGKGHVAICPGFDQRAFVAFRNAYRGKGPEGIPASMNKPGSGPS